MPTSTTSYNRVSCLSNYTAIHSDQLATTSKFLDVHPTVQKTFALICQHINMHPDSDSYLSCTIKQTTLARKRKISLRQLERHIARLLEQGVISTFANSLPTNFGLPKRTANSYVIEVVVLDDLIGKSQRELQERIKQNLLRIKNKAQANMAVIRERIKRKLERPSDHGNEATAKENQTTSEKQANTLIQTILACANRMTKKPSSILPTPKKFTDCHNRYLSLRLFHNEQEAWEYQRENGYWYDADTQIMFSSKTNSSPIGVMRNTHNHAVIINQYINELNTYITQDHKDATAIVDGLRQYMHSIVHPK